MRKFFVEAKKPAVNLKQDPSPALQLRRYAWSAKLPLSLLTDFQELAVYDTRVQPRDGDKASVARTFYFTFEEYIGRWDELDGLFSKRAVLQGSFDQYAESTRAKRGTAEVDDAFLREIESWREFLAKDLARRNPRLLQRDLNFAVQRIIDRIVFLRISEDRGVEDYGRLRDVIKGSSIYGRLVGLFQQADDRYDSGLFRFRLEKGKEAPDKLTPTLEVGDAVLKHMIGNLYYPDCPYEFSVLPPDILGQVYERFLGKTIILDDKHRARVEEKPEIRKAGGVYYTPTYIVDYIVNRTVGELVKGKHVSDVEKLRIIDPACGSGSFLLGAYQYLLNWHLNWYVENQFKKYQNRIRQVAKDDWRLTTEERKRILLNNIFGVDVDPQAVEVTKLSLLLKVLEGETEQSLFAQLNLSVHERALPDLAENIKSGNALIGQDLYAQVSMGVLGEEEIFRVNSFDWEKAFPQVMRAGGFNVIVGNPPYIPIELMTEYERIYYQAHFPPLERKYDSSVIFTLAMLKRLAPGGLLGFISSQTWQTGENYGKMREWIFSRAGVVEIVNLPFDVFKDAYVDTGIFIVSSEPTEAYRIYSFPKKDRTPDLSSLSWQTVPVKLLQPPDYKLILNQQAEAIRSRLEIDSGFVPLGEITVSTQGLSPSRFVLHESAGENRMPYLLKGQVFRYEFQVDEIAYADMLQHGTLRRFYNAAPKILIRRVISRQDRLMATYTESEMVFKKDINPFVIQDRSWDPYFVLAVLNSALISHIYVSASTVAGKDDFRQTTLADLRRLPIPRFNATDKLHKRIAELAREMLRLIESAKAVRTGQDRQIIESHREAVDAEIDRLIYQVYGLTDAEIESVAHPRSTQLPLALA